MKQCCRSSSTISFDQLQQLTTDIYDAALIPNQWENVLKKLGNLLNAEQVNLRILNKKLNNVQSSYQYNKDPHWNKIYKEHYINQDIWLNDILKSKDTFITCTHHHLLDKEYENLEFHHDFVSPQKIHYGMGGKIKISDNNSSFLTLSRDRTKKGFENKYYEAFLHLIPHIQKTLLINNKIHQLELKDNLLSEALNQINSPILLVNKNGKVLFINDLAEQILKRQLGISINSNHILISSKKDDENLKQLIYQATNKNSLQQQAGSMSYKHSDSKSALSILISPVNPNRVNIDIQSDESALLILSTENHQQSVSTKLLSDFYKLSPAETRLVAELCLGFTLNQIAERFSLSKNTLRTQLRMCFNKMEVSRQSELIRLVKEGPISIIKNI